MSSLTHFPSGTWGSDDSHAVFRTRPGERPDAPRIDAWDQSDGERFKITSVRWDGKRLTFTSTMPSTGWVVKHSWRILDASTLEGERSTLPGTYRLRPSKAKPSS